MPARPHPGHGHPLDPRGRLCWAARRARRPVPPPAEPARCPREADDSPAFEPHLKRLAGAAGASPHLVGHDLSDRRGIEDACWVLDAMADRIVREAASSVFLATAVSQAGRLDGLLVLAVQRGWSGGSPTCTIIGRAARSDPPLRQRGGHGLRRGRVARHRPLRAGRAGPLGGPRRPGREPAGVPGRGHDPGQLRARRQRDAFLTLRVGMIAKRYCGAVWSSRRRPCGGRRRPRRPGTSVDRRRRRSRLLEGDLAGVGGEGRRRRLGVSGYAKDAVRLMARVRNGRSGEQPEVG